MKTAVIVLVAIAVGVVVFGLGIGAGSDPTSGFAHGSTTAAPPSPWQALPQTPDGRVGIWTMCSHGVRLFMAVPAPQSGPAITTAADPVCAGS